MTVKKSAKPNLAKIAEESNTEHSHQTALFSFFQEHRLIYPDVEWMFSIPNGGMRTKSQGAILRSEGLKRGVPDICLPVKRGPWPMLWIELKRIQGNGVKAGVVTPEQKKYIEYFKSQGYGVTVCYGWLQAKQIIIEYLNYKG